MDNIEVEPVQPGSSHKVMSMKIVVAASAWNRATAASTLHLTSRGSMRPLLSHVTNSEV